MPTTAPLPLTKDISCTSDEWWYVDEDVEALLSVRGREVTLRRISALDVSMSGKRTGIGRAALQRIRPHYATVVAGNVDEPFDDLSRSIYAFWLQMMREGLVDRLNLVHGGRQILPSMLADPIETDLGFIPPDPVDILLKAVPRF